jgi:hypothetical protein
MTYIEPACYALALLGLVSLLISISATALALNAARLERRALIRQLVRFD